MGNLGKIIVAQSAKIAKSGHTAHLLSFVSWLFQDFKRTKSHQNSRTTDHQKKVVAEIFDKFHLKKPV